MSSKGCIGYLLKAFPVVSETFVLNEMRAMEHHGVPLAVFSLKSAPHRLKHAAVDELQSRVLYVPWVGGALRLLAAHARLALRRPKRYWNGLRRHLLPTLRRFARQPLRRRSELRKRCRRFAWAGWVATQASKENVRHLHAHYAGEPLRVARLVHRLTGLPYSFTAHAKDLYAESPNRLRRRARRARFAVTCHREGTHYLQNLLPAKQRDQVLAVSHGLDTSLFKPRQLERRTDLCLAVGRLTPKKGFDTLLSACAEIVAGGRDMRCRIVGEGALRPALLAQARELGIADRVEIAPFIAHEELPKLLARAAVFVMPSVELADGNRDGVPNALLEAMACATPVVATTVGGITEVVRHGHNGLLVPPADPRALAAAIESLVDAPEFARTLAERAARRAATLDFKRTNEALAARWRAILDEPVEAAIGRAENRAWLPSGSAAKAGKRLGIEPQRRPGVEAAIRRAVWPGISANSWRPDLERLATRRLWDELSKAKRVPSIKAALNGSGELPGAVLDLGCGRGGLAVALKASGVEVVGLDLRMRNCAVTGWRGQRYALQVPAVNSYGEQLPFGDGVFKAVCCMEVLEHVQDPVGLLAEIRRVLAPNGACAITVINRWAHFDPHYHLWGLNHLPRTLANRYIAFRRRTKRSYRDCQTLDEMHYYSYREFERLAQRLGFRVEDPESPASRPGRFLHRSKRRLSHGYNTALLVLRPATTTAS